MTARILIAIAVPLLVAGVAWVAPKVKNRLSPTQPDEPGDDDREAGADEDYGDELDAMKRSEKELAAIAAELELNLLDDEQRAWAVDALDLRLSVAELVDHFDGRVERVLEDWQPGWWEEPAVPLPDFRTLHALIDPTGEFAVVA